MEITGMPAATAFWIDGLGRTVIDLNLHVLAGRCHAVLHHRPERVIGLSMADDDNAGILLRGRRSGGGEGQSCRGSQTGNE
jgi:hypothetical protein